MAHQPRWDLHDDVHWREQQGEERSQQQRPGVAQQPFRTLGSDDSFRGIIDSQHLVAPSGGELEFNFPSFPGSESHHAVRDNNMHQYQTGVSHHQPFSPLGSTARASSGHISTSSMHHNGQHNAHFQHPQHRGERFQERVNPQRLEFSSFLGDVNSYEQQQRQLELRERQKSEQEKQRQQFIMQRAMMYQHQQPGPELHVRPQAPPSRKPHQRFPDNDPWKDHPERVMDRGPQQTFHAVDAPKPSQQAAAAPPPAAPTVEPASQEQAKLDLKFAQARAARLARYQWVPRGTMSVEPRTAYPEGDIEVHWTLPIDAVSKSAYDRNLRPVRGQSKPLSDPSKSEPDCDWIGLFRARTRVDRNDAPILTRRVLGTCHVDAHSGTVSGRLRLRAPRGVGDYDFRYYRMKSPGQEDDELAVVLPVTRSNPVTVEVQGYVLAEALDFVAGTLSGGLNARRFSSGAAQLATLIAQLHTLRRPLPPRGGGRGRGRGRGRGGRKPVPSRSPGEQEQHLMEVLWPIVSRILGSYSRVDAELDRKILELTPKVAEMKETLRQFYEEHREKHQGEESVPEPSQPPPVDVALKKENERVLYQSMRDQTSLGNAVHSVLYEIGRSSVILPLLSVEQVRQLAAFKLLYSPVAERFFPSVEDLEKHVLENLGIRLMHIDLRRLEPNVQRKILSMDFPAVGFAPPNQESVERYSSITPAIQAKAKKLIPGEQFLTERNRVRMRVESIIRDNTTWGTTASLHAFGSSANGFGGHGADLDMSLIIPTASGSAPEPSKVIEDIAELLLKAGPEQYADVDSARKTARIPIIQFQDVHENIECDICIGNKLALRNTQLLKTYAQIDPRVCQVAAIVKKWAKARNINNPSDHTLSSYGYLLLLIHYFQRCKPHPLVPVLQALPENWEGKTSGVHSDPAERPPCPTVPVPAMDGREHDTYFYGDELSMKFQNTDHRRKLCEFAARNPSTVGELLAGFFFDQAFAFDFRRFVVSVRSGSMMQKENKAAEDSWKLHSRTAIEDPFETGYDVGHVLRDNSFQMIRQEFARGFGILSGLSEETNGMNDPTELIDLLIHPITPNGETEIAEGISKLSV